MADKKISALPAATTPLAGTEVLPIVQGGTTDQVSVANLTVGRDVSAKTLTGESNGVGGPTEIFARNTAGGERVQIISRNTAGVSYVQTQNSQMLIGSFDNFAVQFMVNNSSKVVLETNSDVKVSTGNLVIGTAGKGIDFSANTHAAGMTSELLNDYEEGTWTPVLHREVGGAITAVYGTQTGKYVKIGNLVTVSCFVDVTSVTLQGTGANEVRGLPYAPTTNTLDAGSVARNNVFTTDVVHSCFGWSDSRILFSSNVNSSAATAVNWKSGFLNLTFSYFV